MCRDPCTHAPGLPLFKGCWIRELQASSGAQAGRDGRPVLGRPRPREVPGGREDVAAPNHGGESQDLSRLRAQERQALRSVSQAQDAAEKATLSARQEKNAMGFRTRGRQQKLEGGPSLARFRPVSG